MSYPKGVMRCVEGAGGLRVGRCWRMARTVVVDPHGRKRWLCAMHATRALAHGSRLAEPQPEGTPCPA